MNPDLTAFVGAAWLERFGLALIHFLWQGAAIALLVGVTRWLLPLSSSRLRYACSLGALIAAGMAPLATWYALRPAPVPVAAAAAAIVSPPAPPSARDPIAVFERGSLRPPSPAAGPELRGETGAGGGSSPGRRFRLPYLLPHMPWLVTAWGLGVLWRVVRRVVCWWLVSRAGRNSSAAIPESLGRSLQDLRRRMRVKQQVGLRLSGELAGPIAIGVLRPLILLPASLVAGMPPQQLETLIAHELAHIRRYDTVANLLQILIETLLFYHPAVWWIGRLAREDREACADDAVLGICPDRREYARALARVAESVAGGELALAAGGRPLAARIRRILAGPRETRVQEGIWPDLLVLTVLIFAAWMSFRSVLSAETQVVEMAPGQTLEQAIEAAPAGATLRIPPGIFPANIVISKPITLRGAGWERTIIKARKSITTATEADMQAFAREARAAANAGEAAKMRWAWREKLGAPTLTVAGTKDVIIRGIQFVGEAAPGRVEGLMSEPIVRFSACTNVLLADCAVLGPFWDGIHVMDSASAAIENCLVAGLWNIGVMVEGKRGEVPASRAAIRDSDIRNCYHRCVTIGPKSDQTVVSRSRISGSAWHGIRYDAASPLIEGCVIFGNARSGIYASGDTTATIRGNLFVGNEMNGMSCWFANRDVIEGNTFAGNLREGISVLGKSTPKVTRNIFQGHPTAISCGMVAGEKDAVAGAPALEGNLFWKNVKDYESGPGETPVPGRNLSGADPLFANPFTRDFHLLPDSPALKAGIGVATPISLASPWPLTAGEQAIIPASDTRDSEAWKKPGKAPATASRKPVRAKEDTSALIDEAFRIDSKAARDAAVAEIGRRIQAGDPSLALSGLHALGAINPVDFDRSPFRESVRSLLSSPEESIRAAAVGVVATLNPEAADLEKVTGLAADTSVQVRQAAAGSIVTMCDKDLAGKPAAAAALLTLLGDSERSVSRNALVTLWGARISPEIERRLLAMSRNGDTQYDALYFGLSTLPEKSEPVVDCLIGFLSHRDAYNVGGRALWGLGFGVPEALQPKVAAAALRLLQARADPRARQECLGLLARYGTARELAALREMAAQPAISTGLKTNVLGTIVRIQERGGAR